MTTTLDPLLHAVLANPKYDIVRLVYADALEEAGDGERAEFIRVQIALANQRNPKRRPPASKENDRVQDRLEKRINVLWRGGINFIFQDEMCKLFDGSIATVIDPNWKPRDHSVFLVERGFVSSVRCSLAAWCGETCIGCNGLGETSVTDFDGRDYHRGDCPRCHGTGRTPGHGAGIVARHPVERVEFTDAYSVITDLITGVSSHGTILTVNEAKGESVSAAAIRWARAEAVRRELVPDVWSKT